MKRIKIMAFFMTAAMTISTILGNAALAEASQQTATSSNAQREEVVFDLVTDTNEMMTAKARNVDNDYSKLKNLTLHIVAPEVKTATVDELSSEKIRIFLFGDVVECGNTKNILPLLLNRLEGINAEIYYLDIKGNNGSQILKSESALIAGDTPYFLCEDINNEYIRQVSTLFGQGGNIMPFIFIIGEEEETLYMDNYSNSQTYTNYVEELKEVILDAYPQYISTAPEPYTQAIYMYPETQRLFPVRHRDGYTYSSSAPECVDIYENMIHAVRPGTAQLTVSFENMSTEITVHVLEQKENYEYEWDVLKITNTERMKEGLLPLSTLESFQKAADIRSYELGEVYGHIRPDGSHIDTLIEELDISSPWYSGENVAMGQTNPESVMESWMNSQGHKENILSDYHKHIGIGCYKSSNTHFWVQYFGACSGDYTDISLVVNDDVPAEVLEGGHIDDLNYMLKITCSACGETWMPVIDAMCDFDSEQIGEQEVTVSYKNWSDTFPITVNKKVLAQGITVTPNTVTMNPKDTISLTAKIIPEDTFDSSVTWYSTNRAVATVDTDGIVTAIAKGTAEVYCVAKDGSRVESNHCTVAVVMPVESILIAPSELLLKIGEKETVGLTVLPGTADNKAVSWYSTVPEIAHVDSNGVITAVAKGTAEIYCIAQDGSETESNRCKVDVVASDSSNEGNNGSGEGSDSSGSGSEGTDEGNDSSGSGSSGNGSGNSGGENGSSGSGSSGGENGSSGSGSGSSGGGSGSSGSGSGSSGGENGSSGSGSGSSGSGGGSSSGGSSSKGSTSSNLAGPSGDSGALPSYVIKGSWKQGETGDWSFTDLQGISYANTWAAVENPYANSETGQQKYDWFRFDENGKMLIGWYYDITDGNWYYLNTASDGTLGRMMTGWVIIDGYYYYFNIASDGYRGRMYTNETTPDGYQVDENGRWIR